MLITFPISEKKAVGLVTLNIISIKSLDDTVCAHPCHRRRLHIVNIDVYKKYKGSTDLEFGWREL